MVPTPADHQEHLHAQVLRGLEGQGHTALEAQGQAGLEGLQLEDLEGQEDRMPGEVGDAVGHAAATGPTNPP